MEFRYAEVIVDLPINEVDKPFTYLIPDQLREEIEIGYQVKVPFGHRQLSGYVIELKEEVESDSTKLKEIIKLKSSLQLFDRELLRLAKWIADYYQTYLITVLKSVIPSGDITQKTERIVRLNYSVPEIKQELAKLSKRAYKQREVLEYLIENQDQDLTSTALAEKVNTTSGTVRRLYEKDLIRYEEMEVRRDPVADIDFEPTTPFSLTTEQQKALNQIENLREAPESGTLLLKGVTGSGKTEVYLQAIAQVIDDGQDAIVLVPEISLTPQTVKRFKSRFGDQIAIYHSHLSNGERYDEWLRMKRGEAKVVVGARSAIFAPFSNLGLIIIDEEHETSYKQGDHPKYQARKVANKRAELTGAVTVLGTATPALESYYQVQQGNYQSVSLENRIDNRPLPPVEVIDMREELEAGHRSIFSRRLTAAIEDRLAKNEQIILFLNRRGFSTFVLCRECGFVLECPNCDVSLTYHADKTLLRCHYCDYQRKVPDICPECESRYIKYFGAGTQKVEQAIIEEFPTARVLRMDVDTTTRKGAHQRMLDRFRNNEADILLGTQMIAKGHDFPNITLVGVITADTALNFPDFRAAEHTFQLLTQVAGRTGRGDIVGEVVVQTYDPDHYSIQLAKEHDYETFYQQEIEARKELDYPPFTHLINLIIKHEKEVKVSKVANQLGGILNQQIRDRELNVELLGPIPAPLAKLRGKYRWQMILKGRDLDMMRKLNSYSLEALKKTVNLESTVISVDVDPIKML
ncbi:primosomal protein N' [Acetohalobium arabaticum]|uniref:Replication restart protein PriA n=1 Tax=Acetohalobium arabaticum (strain ATCC 49924 / DSM 5501 / Z-7288) TaxID=574087 RepID=D9QR12_ACEAZ|nr:primosomal protein N' [Acetohalobium arabaticum]ADL12953.1 primosomal protein N' [Acetohalobium arabaticum DSM 5501]